MKLHLIKAENMRKAMLKVHECLGSNALIYRSRHTEFGVEILAGQGEEHPGATIVDFSEEDIAAFSGKSINREVEAKISKLDQHIQSLNDKIRLLVRSSESEPFAGSVKNDLYQTIIQSGFSKAAYDAIFAARVNKAKSITQFGDFIWKTLYKVLLTEKHELVDSAGAFAIVGPTGVGKTTTIVKLAMRHVQRYGAESIGIITTDQGDMTIKNMLTYYCDQMNIDLEYAHSLADLNHSLDNMQNKKLVLIDTHGVSQNDKHELTALINMLEYTKKRIHIYLALPCHQQEEVVEDIIREFNFKHVAGCILTKMDEANTINPVSSLAIRYKLPIAYVCHGQDVSKDIRFPNKAYLVTKMMSMHEHSHQGITTKLSHIETFHEPMGFVGRGLIQ